MSEVERREPKADDPIFRDSICVGVPREAIEQFLLAWQQYPIRAGGNPRRMALKAFLARVRDGAVTTDLVAAATHYRAHCIESNALGTVYVMHAATFFGPNERWKDFVKPPRHPKKQDEMEEEIRGAWLRGGRPA